MKMTFDMNGSLDEACLLKCLAWAKSVLNKRGSKPAKIRIDSKGGAMCPILLELIGVLQDIRAQRVLVTETSFAASASALVFLIGNKRIITSDGIVFLHGIEMDIPVWAIKSDRLIPVGDYEFAASLQRVAEVIVSQSMDISLKEAEGFMRTKKGICFRAKEAFQSGIATEIELYAHNHD
jgi:hypothetical protein